MPILIVPVDAVPERTTPAARVRTCLAAALLAVGALESAMAHADRPTKTQREAIAPVEPVAYAGHRGFGAFILRVQFH